MKTLMNKIRSTLSSSTVVRDERGLSTVEYVIILVLIAAAAIVSWQTLGTKVTGKLNDANNELDKVNIENQSQ